jgi:hypothetical protein
MAGGAACIGNAPNTSLMAMSRTLPCRHSEKASRGLCSCHIGSHYIDDALDIGPYVQQDNIRFYHTICKCRKNIREVIG